MKRTFRYYYYRVVRARGEPEEIARGAAIGVFLGFVVPPPFQMLSAILACYLFKANRPVGALGTFVTNPITGPILYPTACVLGMKLLRLPGSALHWKTIDELGHLISRQGMELLHGNIGLGEYLTPIWERLGDAFWGLAFGTFLLGGLGAMLAYWTALWCVRRYREIRLKKLSLPRAPGGRWHARFHPPAPPPPPPG